jgi:hypothetical protein
MSTQAGRGRTRRRWLLAGLAVVGFGLGGLIILRVDRGGPDPAANLVLGVEQLGGPTPIDIDLVAKSSASVRQSTGITPKEAAVFHTTRAAAAAAVDANLVGYDPRQEVVVIEYASGDGPAFDDGNGRGTTITFVYDPRSELSTDYGIGPAPEAMEGLGSPTLVQVKG